jgi:hypothetical protein
LGVKALGTSKLVLALKTDHRKFQPIAFLSLVEDKESKKSKQTLLVQNDQQY